MGRPSDFSADLAELICARLADGETLRQICRDEDMPSKSMVFRWLVEQPEFRDQYARAREAQADAWADEIIDIADDSSLDYGPGRAVRMNGIHGPTERETEPRFDAEHVQRSRLRVDARKWLMGKAAPKKYGDKVAHEVAGKDGGNLVVEIVRFGQDSAPE